ncbi:MAG: hypothetical protein M1831_006979 [Alyxoria varia]|nr:MAG: hypothetical protein M1831_006979 [Alyxoria varia]
MAAQVDITPQFGAELKDGFKPVNNWISNGIEWLDEIQQFYRERSAIEKEYSNKLAALAKKYFEKKSRKTSTLSVGDNPSATPGSLECASLTTWTVQLTALENRASEHDRFSNDLVSNLAEPLKHASTRYEELRKQHAEYAGKLEKERDSYYGDLRKSKGKYDGACQEVENRRKKIDSTFDTNKQKSQAAYQQQQLDMQNVKNSYLLTVNVTNKQKERYYNQYVPDLLDSLQDLAEGRVSKLNAIWSQAAHIETQTLSRSVEYMKHLSSEIPRNNPSLDSMMFVRHNVTNWQEPRDFKFEPSPVWLDDDAMANTESAKTFLRNLLVRSKSSLNELRREVDKRRRDVDGMKRSRQNIRDGREKKDEMEVARSLLNLQQELHEVERQKIAAEIEVSTIITAVGDLSIGARNHTFKSQTFKIPTNCDLCGDRLWGLSAKGFDCQDCGYICHSKCELKVPADCPGEQSKDEKKRLKVQRQEAARTQVIEDPVPDRQGTAPSSALDRSGTVNSMSTLSSGYAKRSMSGASGAPAATEQTTPTLQQGDGTDEAASPASATPTSKPSLKGRGRLVAPPPAQYVRPPPPPPEDGEAEGKPGRMLYDYIENGEGEITVQDGKDVVILEPDALLLPRSLSNLLTPDPFSKDGSGWIKIRSGPSEGLVPAAYVEELRPSTSSSQPSHQPHQQHTHAHSQPHSLLSAAVTSQGALQPSPTGSSISLASSSGGGTTTKSGTLKKPKPAVAPKRGARKLQHVVAMYDYEARSEVEFSMREGERFVLVARDQGDGWAEVEVSGGKTGMVPANYLEDV